MVDFINKSIQDIQISDVPSQVLDPPQPSYHAPPSLGKCFLILFSTPEPVLRRVCEAYHKDDANTPPASALRGLEAYLERNEDRRTSMREIWSPLRDKIIKKTPDRHKSIRIVSFLFNGPFKVELVAVLMEDLETGSKRDALSVVLATEGSDLLLRDVQAWALVRGFLYRIKADRLVPEDNNAQHTKLTTGCLGCVLDLVKGAAQRPLVNDRMGEILDVIEELDNTLLPFYRAHGFGTEVLDAILEIICALRSRSRNGDVAKAISGLCVSLASGLHPKLWSISRTRYEAFLRAKLDEVHRSECVFQPIAVICCSLIHWTESETLNILHETGLDERLRDMVAEYVSDRFQLFFLYTILIRYGALSSKLCDPLAQPLLLALLRHILSTHISALSRPILSMMDTEVMANGAPRTLATLATVKKEDVFEGLLDRVATGKNLHPVVDEITAMFSVRRGLVEQLVQRIRDDGVWKGDTSEYLISHLGNNLTYLIPKLCDLLASPDDQIRSAAKRRVVTVLGPHEPRAEAVSVFVEYIRLVFNNVLVVQRFAPIFVLKALIIRMFKRTTARAKLSATHRIPKTPGEVDAPTLEKSDAKSDSTGMRSLPFDPLSTSEVILPFHNIDHLDALFTTLKTWGEICPPSYWPQVLPILLRKLYAAPQDSIMVRVLSTLAAFWADPESSLCALEIITGWIRLDTWTDAGKGDYGEGEELVFLRLCPFLVLKILPIDAFSSITVPPDYIYRQSLADDVLPTAEPQRASLENIGSIILIHLLRCATMPSQYAQLRQLSLEILARFPVHKTSVIIPPLFMQAWEKGDIWLTKGWVYWLCHVAGLWGRQMEGIILESGIIVVRGVLTGFSADDTEEGQKLHLSAIDFFAIIIALLATEQPPLARQEKTNTFESVLNLVLDTLASPPNESCQTAMANVLSKSFKNLLSEDRRDAAFWLGAMVWKTVLRVAGATNGSVGVAASFQTLFHIVYAYTHSSHHRPTDIAGILEDLAEACLHGLESPFYIVQLSALKLLAACVAVSDDRPFKDPRIRKAVEGAVTGHADDEIGVLGQRVLVALL
ncbi:hypothetical protein SpCBS45565_g08318 [Spizellomyces sp. 'palustris']|nr:hypothetical protein SpCBS45565_g08318 [Spizellomyces sp. 'palustris']